MRTGPGLDAVLPRYDVTERHERRIRASPDQAYRAFTELTSVRSPWRPSCSRSARFRSSATA